MFTNKITEMSTSKYVQRKIYDVISNKRLLFLLIFFSVTFLGILNYFEIYLIQRSSSLHYCDEKRHAIEVCLHCPCEPIDAVYTWVNGSDPNFQEQMKLYASREIPKTVIDVSRYDDKQELKYSLRSLERHAPWIRTIYIVTNGQLPHWLDLQNPRVKVVSHGDLVSLEEDGPVEEILPTFSSPAIETFIHRVPGLSNRFLYINDDIMLGGDVWPEDWCMGQRRKVVSAWNVPECVPGCPWIFIGDRECDPRCNVEECQFEGGDCLNSNIEHGRETSNRYLKINQEPPESMEENYEIPGHRSYVDDNYLKQQNDDLNLLRDVLENEKYVDHNRNSTNQRPNMNVNKNSMIVINNIFYDDLRVKGDTGVIATSKPKTRNVNIRGSIDKFKDFSIFTKNITKSIDELNKTVSELNRNYLVRSKKIRRLVKRAQSSKLLTNRNIKDNRSLDAYAKSLIYTNRIFNTAYGFKVRKVPAHIPFMLDKDIVNAMHRKFSKEIGITKRNRFRSGNDLQFGFAYHHFMLEEKRGVDVREIFQKYDTDSSGTWSDREIRTLLVQNHLIPLAWEPVEKFENLITDCLTENPHLEKPIIAHERYVDSKMPTITLEIVQSCPQVKQQLLSWRGTERLYDAQIVTDAKDKQGAFAQLTSNATIALQQLDMLRQDIRKFICINDNLDFEEHEQNEVIRALLLDFYDSLHPIPSQFELASDVRNRFANLTEYHTWQHQRNKLKMAAYICVSILTIISLCSFPRFCRSFKNILY